MTLPAHFVFAVDTTQNMGMGTGTGMGTPIKWGRVEKIDTLQ